jgi:hypothetical protein
VPYIMYKGEVTMSASTTKKALTYTEEAIPAVERDATSEYREFVAEFVAKKVRAIRVNLNGRTYSSVKGGLTRAAKSDTYKGTVKVRDRKVQGEKRLYIENTKVVSK